MKKEEDFVFSDELRKKITERKILSYEEIDSIKLENCEPVYGEWILYLLKHHLKGFGNAYSFLLGIESNHLRKFCVVKLDSDEIESDILCIWSMMALFIQAAREGKYEITISSDELLDNYDQFQMTCRIAYLQQMGKLRVLDDSLFYDTRANLSVQLSDGIIEKEEGEEYIHALMKEEFGE